MNTRVIGGATPPVVGRQHQHVALEGGFKDSPRGSKPPALFHRDKASHHLLQSFQP